MLICFVCLLRSLVKINALMVFWLLNVENTTGIESIRLTHADLQQLQTSSYVVKRSSIIVMEEVLSLVFLNIIVHLQIN